MPAEGQIPLKQIGLVNLARRTVGLAALSRYLRAPQPAAAARVSLTGRPGSRG